MRSCLAPFFIGREEPGLGDGIGPFDVLLPTALAGREPGSREAIDSVTCAIRDFVAETVADAEMPLVLCGDCVSAIGCVAGLEARGFRPYLLWFDAHGDFHTPRTTISGHLGGMPLAMITGRGDLSLLETTGLTPIRDESVCLVGGRDIEPGESETLRASGIRRCERITEVLHLVPRGPGLWVHFDTDYICPDDAPAMRYPARGGTPALDTQADLRALAGHGGILGVSVSAWAPHLDPQARTAVACWDTISPLLTTGHGKRLALNERSAPSPTPVVSRRSRTSRALPPRRR